MKAELFKQEFNKLFKGFANVSVPEKLRLELELYNKLWNFFLVEDSYYFILNHYTMEFESVSSEIESILGHAPSEFTVQFSNGLIHPEDLTWFLTFGKRIMEFFAQLPISKLMKYKVRYDIRYRKKNGQYTRILYQGIMLEHDKQGGILRTFNLHTDINYLKQEGKPVLSLIGMDGEPSFLDVGSKNLFVESRTGLTKRENQILTLMIQGKLSKELPLC